MPITLGNITFDETHTTVRETYEEVGGRNERRIEISGLITGESTVADIVSALDEIIDAASVEDFSAALSLRTGRRLYVRRDRFTREVAPDRLVGSFMMRLLAKDPFEEAVDPTSEQWPITASGATKAVATGGNVFSKPVITLVASGALVNPSISDGSRTITYSGTVGDGLALVLDGPAGKAQLDGDDVTPYTSGLFPRIEPDGTTLTYTDDATSSHTATATVAFRDRWW